MAVTLSPARAIRQPRHLDARVLTGVAVMVIAIAASMAWWSRATGDQQAVVVATRDLAAGATLQPGDLTVAHVRVDDAMYQAAVPAESLTGLMGKQLAEPIHAQQMVVQSEISTMPRLDANQEAFTIPITSTTAAGGSVRPLDQVQVLVTTDKGKPTSKTTVVLPRVTVYSVGHDDRTTVVNTGGATSSGSSPSQGPASSVTLIVSQEQAVQLANARWNGDLDLGLLPANG